MDTPVISLIVPIYNAERHLARTLNSIIKQSHEELEIVLVDDGSSDSSGTICDDYAKRDDRIQVIHTKNGGPSSARNAGMDAASGDWITFSDSDDVLEPDLCHYLLTLAMDYHADIVQCGAFMEDAASSKKIYTPASDRFYVRGIEDFDADAWSYFGNSNWGKLYRREVIQNVRFDPACMIGEDLYFNLQALARAHTVVLGAEAKYHYIQTEESLFRAAPSRAKLLSCRTMLQKAKKEFRDNEKIFARVSDEIYRNGLDICSKIVFFRKKDEYGTCQMVRNEIRSQLRELVRSSSFSRKEKMKFCLIAKAWPVYCLLLRWSKSGK